MIIYNIIRFLNISKIRKYQIINKMKTIIIICFILSLIVTTTSQCCLQFQANKCVKCPLNMHLYLGNCIFDIVNCQEYQNGFDCSKCQNGYNYNIVSSQCELIPIVIVAAKYTDISIVISDFGDLFLGLYLNADDVVRSTHSEISDGVILGAIQRRYQNGSLQIIMEYQSKAQRFYRTIVDISQSAKPNIISFQSISVPTIKPLTPITFNPSVHSSDLAYIQFDRQVRNQNPNLKQVIGGIFITIKQIGTTAYKLTYSGVSLGQQYEAIGKVILIPLNVQIKSIIQTKKVKPIINVDTNTDNLGNTYEQFDTNNDAFFPVIVNFLETIQPEILDFTLIKSEKTKTGGTSHYYRLTFSTVNNLKTAIYLAKFDQNTYTTSLISASDTTADISKQSQYVIVESYQILKDFHFLITLDQLYRYSNGKYQDAPIMSLGAFEDGNNIYYKIGVESIGYLWEVEAEIVKNSFVVSIKGEKRGQKVEIKQEVNNQTQNSNNTTTTNNNATTDNNASNATTNNNTTNTTNTANNNTTNITNNNATNTTNATNNNTTTTGNTTKNETQPTTIPTIIIQKGAGLTQVTPEDVSQPDFKSILSTIESANPELINSKFVTAYYQRQGFLRSYSIYYQDSATRSIFQVKVTEDMLRKRVYYLSFGRI